MIAFAGLLSCGSSGPATPDDPGGSSSDCAGCYTWKTLRIGAGGWLNGLDVSADGSTLLVRTDTYGAYRLDSGQWRQLVTSSSMPAEDVGPEKNSGVWEIRVAPGNASRLYMSYRGRVYRSDDRGARWRRTAFAPVETDANDDYRNFGQKLAVDPANPDVVYAGTPESGLFATFDGGTSWQRVSTVPAGDKAGITGIAFEASSGTTGGRTRTVYAGSYGNGVWRTTDAGGSWERVAGGPRIVDHAAVSADGFLYVTSADGDPNKVWRLSRDGWADVTPPERKYWHTVAIDPQNPSRLVAGSDGGYLIQSADRGATWGGVAWEVTRRATDIPWHAWTKEEYMSNGAMRFDPTAPGKLWFAEGIGAWTTTVTPGMSSVVWTSQSVGIEQLVANSIVVPPGGRPVLASWDRPLFYVENPDAFPSQHGPNNAHSVVMGWHVDYASTDPSFLAAVVDWWGIQQSCYSTDGGRTWTLFPSTPPWGEAGFGTLAVATPDNIVWVPSNRRAPYVTRDRGRTWQKILLPGVPDSRDGWDGLHWAYFLNRHVVAADRVEAGTFYMYHSSAGLFRSTNGGASWTLARGGELVPYSNFNAKLRSVPGKAGHLFFTAGQQSGGDAPSGAFVRSTDGGASWREVPGVLEVHAFGFGKEAPGASYPTLFIAGWVNGTYGIWSSSNEGQAWTRIGDYPLGSLDQVKAIEGDHSTHGTVYVGFSGSGYAYGRAN